MTVAPVNHCNDADRKRQPSVSQRLLRRDTHDEVAELAVGVVDLNVAGLGLLRGPSDEHRLAARGNRVADGLGDGVGGRVRRRGAAADRDALETDADVRVDGGGLGDSLLTAERHGDRVRRAAAAIGFMSLCAVHKMQSRRT